MSGKSKNWIFWVLVFALFAAYMSLWRGGLKSPATPGSTPGSPSSAEAGQWTSDLDAALAQAKTSRKPLFVKFGADWCGPCVRMDREVLGHKDVSAALADMIAVAVDVDKNPQQASEYGVRGIPLLLVLNPDGGVLARMEGAIYSPRQFVTFLADARKNQS